MRDKVSIAKINLLHPKVRAQFTSFIEDIESALNITIRIAQGTRTFQEQQDIWDQGRTKPGKVVTWAIPGTSYHNYGLAIDAVPFKADLKKMDWDYDFHKWVPFADKYGIKCGINFPPHKTDPDHFELTFGINWRQLLDKYQRKDFIPATNFVNI